MLNECPLCKGKGTLYLGIKNSPLLQNILYKEISSAKSCKRINVYFYYCNDCHYLYNPDFLYNDISYDSSYNNNQLASEYYQKYLSSVADKVINFCSLEKNSSILEIGCGNGYFLKEIMKKTMSSKICGFDPAYDNQNEMSSYINKSYFDNVSSEYDLVVMRHCFDSIVGSSKIIDKIKIAMHNKSRLYIEFPSLDYILENRDFSMLYHECHSYYSEFTISKILNENGLILKKSFSLFNDNYRGIIAEKKIVFIEEKDNLLLSIIERYKKIIIWGISGRAVTILNDLSLTDNIVKYGVDICKDKQGKYIPGTGQLIIGADEAINYRPDLVIVANKNYLNEIMSMFSYATTFVTFDGTKYTNFIN